MSGCRNEGGAGRSSPAAGLVGVAPAALLVAALALGCKGMRSGVNTELVNRVDRVAVVTIGSERGLDIRELSVRSSGEGGPFATLKREMKRGEVALEPALQTMRHYLFREFDKMMPFSLVSENEVLSLRAYQKLNETTGPLADFARRGRAANVVTPSSYRFFTPAYLKKGQSWKDLLLALPSGTDAVLFLRAEYSIDVQGAPAEVSEGDTVRMKVGTDLRLDVIDRQKNTITKVLRDGTSSGSVRFVYGEGYPLEQVAELVNQATGDALDNLSAYLRKKLRKGGGS